MRCYIAILRFGSCFCDQRLQLDDALVTAPATLALDPLHAAALKLAQRQWLDAHLICLVTRCS